MTSCLWFTHDLLLVKLARWYTLISFFYFYWNDVFISRPMFINYVENSLNKDVCSTKIDFFMF